MNNPHYRRLLLMAVPSFVAMYVLMYAMVDRMANVYPNLNQFYMAGLMAASMVIIEMAVMREMYHQKRLNTVIIGASLVMLLGFWLLLRQQAAISDKQFLKSMIPHHAGALLMCKEAQIRDLRIKELCGTILSSQQSQINEMKALLADLKE